MPVTQRNVCICVQSYVYVSVAEAYVSKSELQKDSSFHPLTHIFSVQNYRVTLTIIQAPIKLTKAEKDLYSPQLKKTSLGKRRKFSQRIGTPHCSERYKYTHIHTHTQLHAHTDENTLWLLTGNGLLTALCLKQTCS